MKFGTFFSSVGPFVDPDNLAHLATTAESSGFESMWSVEHVVIPVGYESTYPYDKSGKIPMPESAPLADPLLPFAYAAAVTKTIKFGSGVVILPQHHPLYIAKQAATLDCLTKGRFLLGVGIGWLEEEFQALGIPFSERVGRTEESIQAIRSLWKAEPEPFRGTYYSWDAVHSQPKPVQEGGVPIIVGGHVPGAARRAARYGDGFFPGSFDAESLAKVLSVLRDECGKIGRDPNEIEITAGVSGRSVDTIKRCEDMGVARVLMLDFPGGTRDEVTANLDAYANEVIAKV